MLSNALRRDAFGAIVDIASILTQAVTVTASAFAGASLAFLRERYSARLDKSKRDYSALREAHFVLLQQCSQLASIRNDFLAPEANSPAPWLTMRPTVGYFDAPRLDIAKLLFILEGPEPDVLNRLLVVQHQFLAVNAYFAQRNATMADFQDRLSAVQRDGALKEPLDVEELRTKIGPAPLGRLQTLTTAILDNCPAVIAAQEQLLSDLSALSKRIFPKRRAPKIELLPVTQRARHAA
jgi:hypothetical protein